MKTLIKWILFLEDTASFVEEIEKIIQEILYKKSTNVKYFHKKILQNLEKQDGPNAVGIIPKIK